MRKRPGLVQSVELINFSGTTKSKTMGWDT